MPAGGGVLLRDPQLATQLTIVTPAGLDRLPGQGLGSIPGVSVHDIWHSATCRAGVLRIHAGYHLGEHTHQAHHHHMWITEGAADIGHRRLTPGTYVHVPAGVAHDVDATGTDGCTLFFLYEGLAPGS